MRIYCIFVTAFLTLSFTCKPVNIETIVLQDDKAKQIADYTEQLAKRGEFSGALLIAKNNKVISKQAYGYAHLGHKVKNNVDTKFNLASINKSFTAVAILQLLQQGKISLGDPVGLFLPTYPNDTVLNKVTIKHLLTHKSGIANIFGNEKYIKGSKDLFRTVNDLIPLFENAPMEFDPGKLFAYRNTNYILLGRIIEKITQMPYEDYIKRFIFDPAGMNNTGNYDLDHPIENAAEGYTASEIYPNKLKVNIHTFGTRGNASGGGYSNLDDLFHFSIALRNYKLLNQEFTDLFTTPVNETDRYGLGMQFPNPEKGNIYGHSGGHYGVTAEWRVYAEEDYTIVLLTNRVCRSRFYRC